jgi:hypothetical protein
VFVIRKFVTIHEFIASHAIQRDEEEVRRVYGREFSIILNLRLFRQMGFGKGIVGEFDRLI